MNKQILFSLLLTSTALQSMELTVLHDPDMLFHITEQIICNAHILDAKKNINSLATVNKTLCKYYSREKTQQNIIRQMALQDNMSDNNIAYCVKYNAIRAKILCLFDKAKQGKIFTEDDLKDTWYLNSTLTDSIWEDTKKSTLLTSAIKAFKFETAQLLLDARIDCTPTHYKENPLALMNRCSIRNTIWFDIVTLLLKNNLHPDSRINTSGPTLLHHAALSNNLEHARLFLLYGADPVVLLYKNKNAFELEHGEPKGWLRAMVDEIEKNKQNS